MRIDLPTCGFKSCRYCFDGNCTKRVEYDRCEYREYKNSSQAYRHWIEYQISQALFDKVSEEPLKDQCCSTWIHCLECLTEMADAWEEVNGENLVWVPGHYERKD